MWRVRIILDEAKIAREGIYSVANVWECVDNHFLKWGLRKTDKGVYTDAGFERDYGKFWSIIFSLSDESWFMDNVSEWYWLNPDECEQEVDLLEEFRKVNAAG